MRFPFSRRTDYAIRAAIEIARHGGRRVKRHAIAEAIDAPASVVAQALADLARGGVVVATAGRNGGYVLAAPAEGATLADVVDALARAEGDERRCVLEDRACADGRPCRLHAPLDAALDAFRARLAATTLAELAGALRPAPRSRRAERRPPEPEPVTEPAAESGPQPSLGGWMD